MEPAVRARPARRLGRRAIDAAVRRQARRDRGVIPPAPPHSDVRTPEYVTFDDVQRKPWECVRGMDHSFGYNRCSCPEDFIARDELLWMLTDIAAKGGNLLLNVGPRGVDAQIPDEQITRLDWLGEWVRPNADAIMATRPWVTPGTTTAEGHPVRYTARDDTVYAITRNAGRTDHPSRRARDADNRDQHRRRERGSSGRTPRPASRSTPPPSRVTIRRCSCCTTSPRGGLLLESVPGAQRACT